MPCQQDELYAAEREVRWGDPVSLDEAQRFVDEARDRYAQWPELFPKVRRVEVFEKSRQSDCSVGWFEEAKSAGGIDMIPAHLRPLPLCHELAHVLCAARYGKNAHGPWFVRIYLTLVYVLIDGETYYELYEACQRHGIDMEAEL